MLDSAARQCSLEPPDDWVGTTDPSYVELRDDFLASTVQDVLDRIDPPQPVSARETITGDGSASYALPAAYSRMHRGEFAVYERTTTRRACVPVGSDGAWDYMQEFGSAGGTRYYRVTGYEGAHEIEFYDELETGQVVVVNYVSRNWLADGGTPKAMLTEATDVLLMPSKLLETGVIWRFRQRKGIAFADAMASFEAHLARYSNNRIGTIDMAGPRMASPWDIPVPDWIPSS
jgi:hypothetical protein